MLIFHHWAKDNLFLISFPYTITNKEYLERTKYEVSDYVFCFLEQHKFCSEWSCPTYWHGSTTLTAATIIWARFWMDRTIAVTYCTGLPGMHSFHQTDSMFWWQPRELTLQIQLTQDSPVYLYTFSRIKQRNLHSMNIFDGPMIIDNHDKLIQNSWRNSSMNVWEIIINNIPFLGAPILKMVSVKI